MSTQVDADKNDEPTKPDNLENSGVIRSAAILSIGNIVGRMLGLLSATAMSSVFGAELVGAYEKAAYIPLRLRDVIIGGMVDSALVPVFSDLAQEKDRTKLWDGVSAFLSLSLVVLLGVIALVQLFHKPIATAVGVYEFNDPNLTEVSLRLMRWSSFGVLFLGITSVLTSVLYALKRFTIPAFLTTVFNGTIMVAALVWRTNVSALVYGLLVGSFLQMLIQLPALRDAKLRWNLDLKSPVLRRIVTLYLPIVGGLLVDTAVVTLSYNLATRTGDASQTYMRNATRLIQFPDGLVVTAVSVAILPTLTQQAVGQMSAFKPTLTSGIKLVLALILPATAGLFALAHPIIDLLFGNGAYTGADVTQTALVLQVYLLGLPLAGVDRMLVFASYARKDTWRPALVGVISMLVNATVAVSLLGTLGLFALMVADVVKHLVHTLLMVWVLRRQIGGLGGFDLVPSALKATLAAAATGVVAYLVATQLQARLGAGILSEAVVVGVAGLAGVAVYGVLVFVLDISEVKSLLKRGRG